MDIEHAELAGIVRASNAVERDDFRSTAAAGAVEFFWFVHAQTNNARMQTPRTGQNPQQLTMSTSLTMMELPVMAGCAHTADCAIW